MNEIEILDKFAINPNDEEALLVITQAKKQQEELDLFFKKLKAVLEEQAEKKGVIPYVDNDVIRISYKQGHTRTTIDSKKLKEELPDVAEKYSKTTNVKGSWTIELK